MGRPDVTKDPDGPEFGLFLRFMRENPNVWTKVSCPERLSITGPEALDGEQHAYTDVVPFARRVVEEFPDRVLWGTDWPHPNMESRIPDDGTLVDMLPRIAWGGIWTRPGISRQMRSAVTLTAMVVHGHWEELAMHIRAAVTNGLSRDEIKEILLQTAIYCGVPAANTAFKTAQQVFQSIDNPGTDAAAPPD